MDIEKTIDGLLAEHDEKALFALVLERKRKANHARDKATQPTTGAQLDTAAWNTVTAFARRPIGKDEVGQDGLDHLTMTVLDCLSSTDTDDLLFALLRVWRKCYHLQPHLGPIEGVPQQ